MSETVGVIIVWFTSLSAKLDCYCSPFAVTVFFSDVDAIRWTRRHYKEEAEIASMTWKIAWSEVVLFSGDRTGRSSGGGGPTGVGKFGSRLSIGRNSILVLVLQPLALRRKHKFRINFFCYVPVCARAFCAIIFLFFLSEGKIDNPVISFCLFQSNLSTETTGNFPSDKQLFIQTANYKVGQLSLRSRCGKAGKSPK